MLVAGENHLSPGGREQELREQGKGVAPLPADQMPTFVCFVLSGCFPDPITVKGNDIWE